MKKSYDVQLTDEQRTKLKRLIQSGKARARVIGRARILLLAEKGKRTAEISHVLMTSEATVQRIRKRFAQEGLEGALADKPRQGRPPTITGEVEAKLTMLACSDPPAGRARWTLQLLADQMVALEYIEHMCDVSVYNTLKKTS